MPHQRGLEKNISQRAKRLSDLCAVLYTLGGALLGAAAIVSSLVLFSTKTLSGCRMVYLAVERTVNYSVRSPVCSCSLSVIAPRSSWLKRHT